MCLMAFRLHVFSQRKNVTIKLFEFSVLCGNVKGTGNGVQKIDVHVHAYVSYLLHAYLQEFR